MIKFSLGDAEQERVPQARLRKMDMNLQTKTEGTHAGWRNSSLTSSIAFFVLVP